jgi:predicted metal-dependent HD superfamily phosphohydrolase
MAPDLLSAWRELIDTHCPAPQATDIGAALIAAWSEPHRRYHTVEHLRSVLQHVDELATHADDPDAVRLAAWYHDTVYQGAADDEERSARRAENELTALRLAPDLVAEVARLVRLTATHDPQPGDRNGETLSDADLAILAAPTEQYQAYCAAVRAEYAHIPDDAFAAGRATLLATLLEAPALYRTPHAHQQWEPQARNNLRAELTQLRRTGAQARS